ncbi:MAG: HAMP domain-containing histidine kinase [Hyphomicrobiaceae bacterium]|nr:HAMP domain-containing histidine kinase [Hyphomicrobiaceae bacterium]
MALGTVVGGHFATLTAVAPHIGEEPALVVLTLFGSIAVAAAVVVLGRAPAERKTGHAKPQATGAHSAEVDLVTASPLPVTSPAAAVTITGAPLTSATQLPPSPPAAAPRLKRETASNVSRATHNDLMARVSHELRTPLNAVVGFSDLMGHEMFGPLGHPRYEEYVGYIRESGRKLLKSTEDTLAITSLLTDVEDSPKIEEVALGSLARDARQIVAAEARQRDVRIVFEIDTDVAVLAHRRALRQILVNLMSEALVRAEVSGEITMAADVTDDRVLVRVAVTDANAGGARVDQASLPICIARTLVELSGGRLLESFDEAGRWQVSTLLERAAQPDFFLSPRRDVHAAARLN